MIELKLSQGAKPGHGGMLPGPKVTAEIAKAHAESEFEKYRIVQDRLFESDFDRLVKKIGTDKEL